MGITLTINENKGADQLCSYCTADLRLCFRINNLFFHDRAQLRKFLYKVSEILRIFMVRH